MKNITETRDKRNFERVRALFVTYTRVTTLHSCFIKNATVFSQSDACDFSMYIINTLKKMMIMANLNWQALFRSDTGLVPPLRYLREVPNTSTLLAK